MRIAHHLVSPRHVVFSVAVVLALLFHGLSTSSSITNALSQAQPPAAVSESSLSPIMSLILLTQPQASDENPKNCTGNNVYLRNTVLDERMIWDNHGRKIPRVVHMHLISQPRCASPGVAETIDAWRLVNYSVFLHDDDAIEQLLWRRWEQFPQLHTGHRCIVDAVRYKSELWRLLALWEYGGIYTDRDRVPQNFNATTIRPDDEAFFVVDGTGVLQSEFFAVAPRHPFIFYAIHQLTQGLFDMKSIDDRFEAYMSVYVAFKNSYKFFAGFQADRVELGVVRGPQNSTLRVGSRDDLRNKRTDLFHFVKAPSTLNWAMINMTTRNAMYRQASSKIMADYEDRFQSAGKNLRCLEHLHMFDKLGGASRKEAQGLFYEESS